MQVKTTINAYTLIGMSSKKKVAKMLGISIPTLRQKLNGSIGWTLNDVENMDIETRSLKTMLEVNKTVESLNSK
jgi:predicted transcriptional regulator